MAWAAKVPRSVEAFVCGLLLRFRWHPPGSALPCFPYVLVFPAPSGASGAALVLHTISHDQDRHHDYRNRRGHIYIVRHSW